MKARQAVRAVFLTPEGRILLMKIDEPISGQQVWITPGGAIEPGESPEAGLRREIQEETGVLEIQIGPIIWRRAHQFGWNGREYSQQEAYYLVRTEPFEPSMDKDAAPGEWSAFRGFRWWSAEEIRSSQDRFAPRQLADHLEQLIHCGPTKVPLDVGV